MGENKEILENKADLETIIDFTGADDWTKRQSASSSGRAEKVQGDPWGLEKEAPTTQGEVWESKRTVTSRSGFQEWPEAVQRSTGQGLWSIGKENEGRISQSDWSCRTKVCPAAMHFEKIVQSVLNLGPTQRILKKISKCVKFGTISRHFEFFFKVHLECTSISFLMLTFNGLWKKKGFFITEWIFKAL